MTRIGHITGGIAIASALLAGASGPAGANALSTVLVVQGQQAMAKQDLEAARRAFEQAIVADPNDARAYGDLGIVQQRRGAVDKAWRYYRAALDIEPNNVSVLGWSGDLDVSIGRLDSAQRKLDRLRQLCGTCEEYRQLSRRVADFRAHHRDSVAAAKDQP